MTFRAFRILVCTGVLSLALGWVADAADLPGTASGGTAVWAVAGTVDHDGLQFTARKGKGACPRWWPLPWC